MYFLNSVYLRQKSETVCIMHSYTFTDNQQDVCTVMVPMHVYCWHLLSLTI